MPAAAMDHQRASKKRKPSTPLDQTTRSDSNHTHNLLAHISGSRHPATTTDSHAPKKRKPSTSLDKTTAKKPRPHTEPTPSAAQDSPLRPPHASILADLAAKYDVLDASVLSSTAIRKRLVRATTHLLGAADPHAAQGTTRPRVVLLHARPGAAGKMITVAETCKRLLLREQQGGQAAWYQYNQLFDLPREDAERAARKKKGKRVVEETVLHVEEEEEEEEEEEDDESDAFETMQARFEKAVLPRPPQRTTKSLRIFLSTVPIPELKAKDGVTVQTSDK